jgi:hypothetical protein
MFDNKIWFSPFATARAQMRGVHVNQSIVVVLPSAVTRDRGC